MREDKARGETMRHETLIETRRRNTQQQPCREKRGDHHSPMKHGKRRMLGGYGQGRRHAPHLLKAGLPAHYLVKVNSRKNARGEQKCKKSRRLYNAEM